MTMPFCSRYIPIIFALYFNPLANFSYFSHHISSILPRYSDIPIFSMFFHIPIYSHVFPYISHNFPMIFSIFFLWTRAFPLLPGNSEGSNLSRTVSVLRVARALRVLRTARIVRVARYMPELMWLGKHRNMEKTHAKLMGKINKNHGNIHLSFQ